MMGENRRTYNGAIARKAGRKCEVSPQLREVCQDAVWELSVLLQVQIICICNGLSNKKVTIDLHCSEIRILKISKEMRLFLPIHLV